MCEVLQILGAKEMTIKDMAIIIGAVVGLGTLVQVILYQFYALPRFNKSLVEFEANLRREEYLNQKRWEIRRDACLKALDLADAMISNYQYENVQDGAMVKSEIKTEDVRKCINELACSCEQGEVLEQFKKIIFGKITPAVIVDLRNAVRRELEFGTEEIDMDRERAFVGKIFCDPKVQKKKAKNGGSVEKVD